jgi:hypothetical protein
MAQIRGLAGVTLICGSQRFIHLGNIADINPTELTDVACSGKRDAHFFHPAAERYLAYIFPIAPIPISPMIGCSSTGASGVTSGRIML